MTERKRKLDVYDNGTTGFSSQPPPLRAGVNPFTGRPYSARYFDILSKRKGRQPLSINLELQQAAHPVLVKLAQLDLLQELSALLRDLTIV